MNSTPLRRNTAAVARDKNNAGTVTQPQLQPQMRGTAQAQSK
jgi:hypothetical protein